jgi:hypothetical protein
MNETYKRTPQDLANEYSSAMATIAARQRRVPATTEGMEYAAAMDAIAASLTVCLAEPGVLVATPEDLTIAEQALIDARAELAASVEQFSAMDTARKADATPAPQIVVASPAARVPIANAAQ